MSETTVTPRSPDEYRKLENERAGHTLCAHCEGTGNELFAMFRRCERCGGSGYTARYGERLAPVRAYLLRRERVYRLRECSPPRDPKLAVRCLLSHWLGIGHYFHDRRDTCCHCGAQPSDVDFEMRRVAPFRAECWDADLCREGAEEVARYA